MNETHSPGADLREHGKRECYEVYEHACPGSVDAAGEFRSPRLRLSIARANPREPTGPVLSSIRHGRCDTIRTETWHGRHAGSIKRADGAQPSQGPRVCRGVTGQAGVVQSGDVRPWRSHGRK
jgi:hypothetical protein